MIKVGRRLLATSKCWFAVLQYPFPRVHTSTNMLNDEPKDKVKRVKFIKTSELETIEGANKEKIEQFNKSHKTTFDSSGQKTEFINLDKSHKVTADFKGKIVLNLSQLASRDPSIQGAVSEYISSGYEFHHKSTQKRKNQPEIFLEDVPNSEFIIEMAHSRSYARQLANRRANVATPEFMENECRQISEQCGLQMKVIKNDELEKEGLRLMHAVGRASINKPRMVNLCYNGNAQNTNWLAFVGKGLCFDSGGLNIKVANSMMGMHLDKHGSVSVMSAMRSIARLKLPINITASLGFVENSIDCNAYRPGDIIESRKGLTVEIGNTDAEGRLVLADVMHWTQQHYKPKQLIELSTLTGAIIVALGQSAAGLFSNSNELIETLKEAANQTKQHIWHMPILEQHRELVKPKTADLTNASGKPVGGSAQAAAFLEVIDKSMQSFVEKGVEWAHIDIAGASMDPSYVATGYGSRLLIKYAQLIAKNNTH